MRKLTLLIISIGLLLIGCSSDKTPGNLEGKTKAPNFSLPDFYGNTFQLGDCSGKVIVLNFWATWCQPCLKEIPSFVKLREKFPEKSLQIIGINLDTKLDVGKMKNFIQRYEINYPILMGQADPSILKKYGNIRSIPTTFFIDQEGYIRYKLIGFQTYSALEAILTKLLDEEREIAKR
ncbi:hypothetical protein DRQ33_04445 [bacterium]|nr:MAG: hypothetical protein DRQ33_04445 [bacterium]